MARLSATLWAIAVIGAVPAGTSAQAAVEGQVTIVERAGDVTEDLENVVVYLEPLNASARKRPLNSGTTIIQLSKRQFAPRVRVVTAGSRVEFPNTDPWNHNVFSKTNGGFDTGVYGRGKTRDQRFDQPGVYPLYCNVHPRMTAFVVTLDTPLFTQAGEDGRFRLDSVPAGAYRLHVWHDRATELVKDITVPASGVVAVREALDARGYKYVQHRDKNGKDYAARGDRY